MAKRKLREFKNDLERTDATKGNTSFGKVLDDYTETLQGAESTLTNKLAVVAKLKEIRGQRSRSQASVAFVRVPDNA